MPISIRAARSVEDPASQLRRWWQGQDMHHGAPYSLKVGRAWKVVVPIRGRLSPKFCKLDFCDKRQADAWLLSEEAQAEIDAMRDRPKLSTKPSVRTVAQPLHA